MYTCGFRINANLVKEGSIRINANLVKEELNAFITLGNKIVLGSTAKAYKYYVCHYFHLINKAQLKVERLPCYQAHFR